MRVAHLTSVHPPDDVRIFAKECRTLATAGYEVHLVAPGAREGERDGVLLHPVAARPDSGRLRRMTSTVQAVYGRARALSADLYHFHDPELMPAGLRLAGSGAAVVYDAHEDLAATVLDKAWIRRRLRHPAARVIAAVEPAAASRLTAVVAATPAIAERFARVRCEVVTVNNFPELAEFEDMDDPPARRDATVCFVGAITAIRGIDVMIDAIARTEARLVLAGTFESPELQERVRAAPGWSRVEHLGRVGRAGVREVLARSAAGVVLFQPAANHVRSQPTKLFEYMAAGLPVVASDFPWWREIVDGADCGICVDPANPEAVAEAIQWIVTHREAARAMGQNGRRAVASTYNWSGEAAKLAALYGRILS